MPSAFCGIYYFQDSSTNRLPPEEVQVHAYIVDVSARVTLVQVFENTSDEPTPSAKYVFPVPASAAVCAFDMRTEDGQVVTGVVKEKRKAAEEHEAAKRRGRMTGLVEWATDDAFTISLGCLPAKQRITTTLTYAISLMNDDLTDQIRFQLPMCIGERYGQVPETMKGASAPDSLSRLKFSIYIQTKGPISSILSPSHPDLVALPYQSENSISSTNRMIARYESPQYLTQDFILTIQAQGLNEPRCFAERDEKHNAVAMHLTFVPKFDLPLIAAQEYIFLIDRSGSMMGSRIEMAKKTLVMLLRALPARGTSFNIVSFGDKDTKLFPTSKIYNQSTLGSATEHVDGMSANYGGTEIRSALENTFKSQSKTLPTSVFVLTDGDAYDIDKTLQAVSDATEKSTAKAPLRVFTLGIGFGASSAMCEGIARAGNGVCLMATEPEGILGKTSKLLRASRGPVIKNVSVDWGIPASLDPGDDDMQINQVPSTIDTVYTGFQFIVTAIIKNPDYRVPREVVFRGQESGQLKPIEIKVPVRRVELSSEDESSPFIATLAARRLITQLEDPKRYVERTLEWRQETITRIGEEYHLASRYTSFIAVGDAVRDEDQAELHQPGRLWESQHASELEEDDEEEDDDMLFGSYDNDIPVALAAPPRFLLSLPSLPAETPAAGSGDPVVELVRLQSFDGSFTLSNAFKEILGEDACKEGKKRKMDDHLWATLLAIVYLRKHLANQPELLGGLVEKAIEFIGGYPGVDADALLEVAEPFVT